MKTTMAILLVVGVVLRGATGWGQLAPPARTETPKPAETTAGPAASAPAQETAEKIPVLAALVPPLDTIQLLADQAQLQVQIDTRIQNGLDATGKPIPQWNEEVSVRWENVTAREALEDFLSRYGMVLVRDEGATTYRITYKTAPPAAPTTSPKPAQVEAAATPPTPPPTQPPAGEPKPGVEAAPESVVRVQEKTPIEAIKFLAQDSGVKLVVDLRLETASASGVDAEGKPAAYFTNTFSERWEGVTSRQVLDTLVDKYALTLIENTNTQIARLAFKATKEPPVTRLIQLMYAQPTNVVGIVSNALSTGSIVLPDSRSGTLLIRAPQTEIEFVETLLEKLDVAPKQVLIEAQLIETQRNPQSFKGIDWSRSLGETGLKAEFGAGRKISTTTTGAGSTVGKPGGGTVTTPGATTTGEPVFEFGGPDRFTTPVASVFAATASGFNPNFAFLSADGLQAVLHFLNSDSDTRTLSTPRVVAMDNQETRLEVIQGIPIFDASEVVPQTAGPVISSTKPNYTNVGAILIVTPRVVSSNVALTIKPEISAVGPLSTKTVAGKLTQADTFTSSKIAAQVMVPNGSTLVMGGLSLDDTSRKYNKVPLLGDLPLVGLAFRKEEKRRNKRNLVIFVTPTIVRDTDFQPTTTEFLKTAKPPETEVEDSVFESGKPYDWKKSLKFLK